MKASFLDQLKAQSPFSLIDEQSLEAWLQNAKLLTFRPGERILRPDEISDAIFLVIRGQVRILENDVIDDSSFTLDLRGSGQLLGWINLLRGGPTEYVQASTETTLLALPASGFVKLYKEFGEFAEFFDSQPNPHESYQVYSAYLESQFKKESSWSNDLQVLAAECRPISHQLAITCLNDDTFENENVILLSTPNVKDCKVGEALKLEKFSRLGRDGFVLPLRFLIGPKYKYDIHDAIGIDSQDKFSSSDWAAGNADLHALGILEEDQLTAKDNFPAITGNNEIGRILSIAEMISLTNNVPFRKDALSKIVASKLKEI